MNFFAVGFLLGNMQLDLGWVSGYVIKLVGALFMLGGIAELAMFYKKAERLRLPGVVFLVLCATASAGSFAAGKMSSSVQNVCAAVCGVLTTAAAALFFKRLIAMLLDSKSLFRRGGLLERASKRYNIMLVITAVFLSADIINRFTGGTMTADAAGVLMFFSKIVFYIYLIMNTLDWFRLRADFNSINSDGPSDNLEE